MQSPWILPLGILLGVAALGYLVRAVVLRRLSKLFARTATPLDDLILGAIRRHVPLWFMLGGLVAAAHSAPISERAVRVIEHLGSAAFVLSLSFAAASLGTALLGRYTLQAGAAIATTSLVQNVLRIVILSCGALLVLANLGISIAPLLTALGVGSLAVALALQPTLSNLFAGLHMALARPIRLGDFVELENGTQGYVQDIGWRSTHIRQVPNNLVVVPNARVADMIVKNYNLPAPEQVAVVQIGVAYESDLEQVERVTCEVARDVLREVPGGVLGEEPFIRYHTFGDRAIQFGVHLRVRQFGDRAGVIHELIKRLKARYESEGIDVPHQLLPHVAPPPPPEAS